MAARPRVGRRRRADRVRAGSAGLDASLSGSRVGTIVAAEGGSLLIPEDRHRHVSTRPAPTSPPPRLGLRSRRSDEQRAGSGSSGGLSSTRACRTRTTLSEPAPRSRKATDAGPPRSARRLAGCFQWRREGLVGLGCRQRDGSDRAAQGVQGRPLRAKRPCRESGLHRPQHGKAPAQPGRPADESLSGEAAGRG